MLALASLGTIEFRCCVTPKIGVDEHSMEQILRYLARAEECQILAVTAPSDEFKIEYLKLSVLWTDLAGDRRQFLVDTGRTKPH
jgi:hypothetical protein